MRVALLLLLLVGTAAAEDFQARYPPQTAIEVEGKPFGALRFAAEPGDAAVSLVHVRGNGTGDFTLEVRVDNQTVASESFTWLANQSNPWLVRVQWTVPDLEPGEHVASVHLLADDDNPRNNDPPGIPFRIGAAAQTVAHETRLPWLGPLVAVGLLAMPFLRGTLAKPGQQVAAFARTSWETLSTRWIHLPAQRRAVAGGALVVGASVVMVIVLIVAAGRVAVSLTGAGQALLLSAGLSALVAATLALRKQPLRPAALTLAIAFALGLLWQQLAAVTALVRWPDPASLVPFFVLGLSIGAIYALIALGYTMVYGILKFINFAHGEVFLWGGYFAWMLVVQFPVLPVAVAILASIVLTALLGATIERVAYRPLRGGDRLTPLITAIAVSLLLAGLAQMVFGTRRRTFTEEGSTYGGTALREWLAATRNVLGAEITNLDIMVMIVSVTLMAALGLYIARSRMGQAMRAVSDDMETARTVGIPINRVVTTTFIIGSGLAAVGGAFWGLRYSLYPTLGLLVGIKAFTAAVIGGIGNIYGAFLGGILIGLAENVGSQFMDSRFLNAITVMLLLAFLLVRPQGMLGKGGHRK